MNDKKWLPSVRKNVHFIVIVVFSIDMYSERKFVQWLMLIECFDFQLRKTVFLATVREISRLFFYVFGILIIEVSPSRQSCGDVGILQSKMVESFLLRSPRMNKPVGRP